VGTITLVPVWIIQDVVLLVAAVAVFTYIVKRERQPLAISIEVAAFGLLYAGVYENAATWVGWYEYGRSLIMLGNVPIAVPLYEALVYYAALKLVDRMAVPGWIKPFGAGLFAVIQDFALDPVNTHEVFKAREGVSAHWTFLTPPTPVSIYGEPTMNFTSWMFLVGVPAGFMLAGRTWHRRSGYRRSIGIAYPLLGVLGSLALLFSPLSHVVLFGQLKYDVSNWRTWPTASVSQWYILAAAFVVPLVLFAVFWRGRFTATVSVRDDGPLLAVLVGVPVAEVVFCLAGGYTQILWLVGASALAMLVLVGGVYLLASRARPTAPQTPPDKAAKLAAVLA
jgi:hypothetical protein